MAQTQRKGRAQRQSVTCAACRVVLASWAACERHRDETGHSRFEVLQ